MSRRPCVGEHKNCEKTIVNTEQSGVCLVFPATKLKSPPYKGGESANAKFRKIPFRAAPN